METLLFRFSKMIRITKTYLVDTDDISEAHQLATVVHPKVKIFSIGEIKRTSPNSILPKSIAYSEWPMWAKALSMIAKPEDKGIGDVVARTIGAENSEAFKKWFKATTGKDCGCTGRQRRWNIEYPLNLKAT